MRRVVVMMSLKQEIRQCSDEQYQRIARLWCFNPEHHFLLGDIVDPFHTLDSHDYLLIQMQQVLAARFVWSALSTDERAVLSLAVGPGSIAGIPVENIKKKTGLADDRVEQVLSELKAQYLVEEQTVLSPSRTKVRLVSSYDDIRANLHTVATEYRTPSKDRTTFSLSKMLGTIYANDLQFIAQRYRLDAEYYIRKEEAISLLHEKMTTMSDPLDFFPDLDPHAHKLFNWLRTQSGPVSIQAAQDYMGIDTTGLYELIHVLEHYALAFSSFHEHELTLFIPADFITSLAQPKTTPEKAHVQTQDAPAVSKEAEPVTLYDLATTLGVVYQQTVEPTQTGFLPKRISNKLAPQLQGPARYNYDGDNEYPELLFYILQKLNVVQLTAPTMGEIKPFYTLAKGVKQWGSLSPAEQTHALLSLWLTDFHWRDVAGTNFSASTGTSYYLSTQKGREVLVQHLRHCQPGQWYDCESLLRELWEDAPQVMRTGSPYGYTYNKSLIHETKKYENWRFVEGEIYLGMLSRTLHELGMITPGYNSAATAPSHETPNPDAFLITELGATVLHRSESTDAQPVAQHSLIVQPSFELLLMHLDTPALYALLPFAQVEHVGRASRLTLTRNSVLNSLKNGLTQEQIVQTLEKYSQKELPQNVVYTLGDWSGDYQEAKVSLVYLLEVSSEDCARRLCNLSELKKAHARQVAPCIVLVDSDLNPSSLKRLLTKENIDVHFVGEAPGKQKVARNSSRY